MREQLRNCDAGYSSEISTFHCEQKSNATRVASGQARCANVNFKVWLVQNIWFNSYFLFLLNAKPAARKHIHKGVFSFCILGDLAGQINQQRRTREPDLGLQATVVRWNVQERKGM